MRDDLRRVVLDERGEPVGVAGIDAMELRAPQPPARRHEVDADDLGRPVARFDELGDASSQLAAHAGDEDARVGHERSLIISRPPVADCGKRITSRIDETPASNMMRRSTPRPMPPVGGNPYSSART